MQVKEYTQPDMFSPVPAYYNTTKETGETLVENTEEAKVQEERIEKLFKKYFMLTPSKCWRLYQDTYGMILLTSCRRAITNLTKLGTLIKTEAKSKGFYNRNEYVWKYNPQPIINQNEEESTTGDAQTSPPAN